MLKERKKRTVKAKPDLHSKVDVHTEPERDTYLINNAFCSLHTVFKEKNLIVGITTVGVINGVTYEMNFVKKE